MLIMTMMVTGVDKATVNTDLLTGLTRFDVHVIISARAARFKKHDRGDAT
jgi:hypothetical protein